MLSLENHRAKDGVSCRLIGSRPDPGGAQSGPDQIRLFVILSVSLCQSALKTLSCGDQAVNNCAASADRYSLYRTRVLTGALWDRPSAPM